MSFRVNIGSGGQLLAGWVHLDRGFTDDTLARAAKIRTADYEPLLQYELTDLPLPFDDDTAEMILAHHCLCMFEPSDLDALLADIFRVMEPGGVLRVSLFDVALAAAARDRGDSKWFIERDALVAWPEDDALPYELSDAFAWMVRQGGARKWVSTPFLFGQVLETAGFKVAHVAIHETTFRKESICDLDSREGESFFIEGHKP